MSHQHEVLPCRICSGCGVLLTTPRPSNTGMQGSLYWSDGVDERAPLPGADLFGKCNACGQVFWSQDLEPREVATWASGKEPIPWESFQESGEAGMPPRLRRILRPFGLEAPGEDVHFQAIPTAMELLRWCQETDPSRPRRIAARLLMWRLWNGARRTGASLDLEDRERENLAALVELYRPAAPADFLLLGEMLRQLARWREATDAMDEYLRGGVDPLHDKDVAELAMGSLPREPDMEPMVQELYHRLRLRDRRLCRLPSPGHLFLISRKPVPGGKG